MFDRWLAVFVFHATAFAAESKLLCALSRFRELWSKHQCRNDCSCSRYCQEGEPRHQHIPNTITTTSATDAKTKPMLLHVGKDLSLYNVNSVSTLMSGSRSLELIWKLTFHASARGSRGFRFGDPGACRSKSSNLTEHGYACNYAFCFEVVSVLRAARQRGPFTQVRSDSPVSAHCHIILP